MYTQSLAVYMTKPIEDEEQQYCWCYENVLSPWCDDCRTQREEE